MAMKLETDRLWRVYVRGGGYCVYCGRVLRAEEAYLDHDEPGVVVDAVSEDSLSCACGDCRHEKGDQTGAEYRSFRRLRHAREMLHHLAGGHR